MNQMGWTPLGPPPLPPVPSVPPPLPVAFSGDRGAFVKLVRRGVGLELITVGFYRFWLVTDIRRHLWSNTVIDGDAAEYTGRARELLIGFLFALAILVPVYLAYFLLSIEAERTQKFAGILSLAFFYLFGQFAIYRARRYRLTRTVWRGVRFWMDGSGWSYAARATLWTVLTNLSLGLALPWRAAALERYKMQHSYYGDLQGSFEGTGLEFFKRGWLLWLLVPFAIVLLPAAPFLYAEYKAVEWRWWLSGVRFGGVRLESALPRRALYGLYWKAIGWSALFSVACVIYIVGCLMLVATLSGVSFEQMIDGTARSIPLMILSGIGYVVLALALNVVMRVYLQHDVWEKVLASMNVHGIDAAANVSARGEVAGALGEGFADGLDVAGF